MSIAYPFAALPNQVCRGGHGAINVAVLAVMLSHGRTTAAASTLAREIGCSRTSVFAAINYWIEHGPAFGITIKSEARQGETTVYEIDIQRMEEPVQLANAPVQPANTTRSTREHKEEPVKKTSQEDNINGHFEKFWKAYPRKVSRMGASRAYASAFKRNSLTPAPLLAGEILAALLEQCKQEQWRKDQGKFIPHAQTWLNQERWKDETRIKIVHEGHDRFNEVESETV